MSGKQKLSVFQQVQRKKMSRKECPGCNNHLHLGILGSIEKNILACNNQWNCFKC